MGKKIIAVFMIIAGNAAVIFAGTDYSISPIISVFRSASVALCDTSGNFIINPAALYCSVQPEITLSFDRDYIYKNISYSQMVKSGFGIGLTRNGAPDNDLFSLALGGGLTENMKLGMMIDKRNISGGEYSNISFSGMVTNGGTPGSDLRIVLTAGLYNVYHRAILPRTLRLGAGLEDAKKNKFRITFGYLNNIHRKEMVLGCEARIFKQLYMFTSLGNGFLPIGCRLKLSNAELSFSYNAREKVLFGITALLGKTPSPPEMKPIAPQKKQKQKNENSDYKSELQKQYYESGMDYFLDGNFIVAEEKFREVISVSENTDYSKKAKNLLEKIQIFNQKNNEQQNNQTNEEK